MKKNILLALICLLSTTSASAKLNVVTTLTDLRAIAAEVGGDLITVESIAKGTQDPHYIEAKPSFMVKASRADLMVSIGLDLEIGWLPSILNGARNPKIVTGSQGYLEVGPLVNPVEVITGNVTRSEGDVHPFGNPHVTLDPIRCGDIGVVIAERMGKLDTAHAGKFMENAKRLQARMVEKSKGWQARISKSGITKVVSYHKTLTYFFDRFHLENPAILEPKPGIPPTSGHIIDVINIMKEQNIQLILVENYFDPTVTNKIKQELPLIKAVTVPVAVDGAAQIHTIDDLFENLVSEIEKK